MRAMWRGQSIQERAMANVVRFDPFDDLALFDPFRDVDRLFGPRRMRRMLRDMPEEPTIRMDVTEDDKAYCVKAEIPGARKEDISVSVDGNAVTISAETRREKEEKKGETVIRTERYYGKQSRSFSLAKEIDSGKADAKYENGVLELTLPKREGTTARELKVE
jgi:HSP20 family protein